MGVTHYWQRDAEFDADKFAAAVLDIGLAVKHIGVPLAGAGGDGDAILTQEMIVFNGRDVPCEDFAVRITEEPRRAQPRVFSYCKTEGAPYDFCVKAALIVLRHHLGDAIAVTSDVENDAWQDAREGCQSRLGYGADFVLDES